MRRRLASHLCTAACVTALLGAAGCYHRVVRTEGPVGDQDVYEANSRAEPDKLDEVMWGTKPDEKVRKSRWSR